MESNIIAGLVSGLIVTLFIVVFRSLWNSVITPWFENRVYKDIRIEGTWFSLYPSSPIFRQELIKIKRKGHGIVGVITCQNGGDEGEQYTLQGSFRNMILPITYESADLTKSDRGTITLRCLKNGEQLAGKIACYDSFDDTISTGNVIWFRSNKDLNHMVDKLKKKQKELTEIKKQQKIMEKQELELECNEQGENES